MAIINKPSQPLIPPTDVEEVEEIATNAAAAAIAADDTHAPLVDDKVPAANLPSYVDDVLNFASADEFPEEGEEGKIYVANDTNLTYRWSGVAYIQVGGASLAPGDGIEIENDIVSIDLPYIEENLDHVTTDELATELDKKADKGYVLELTELQPDQKDPSILVGDLTDEQIEQLRVNYPNVSVSLMGKTFIDTIIDAHTEFGDLQEIVWALTLVDDDNRVSSVNIDAKLERRYKIVEVTYIQKPDVLLVEFGDGDVFTPDQCSSFRTAVDIIFKFNYGGEILGINDIYTLTSRSDSQITARYDLDNGFKTLSVDLETGEWTIETQYSGDVVVELPREGNIPQEDLDKITDNLATVVLSADYVAEDANRCYFRPVKWTGRALRARGVNEFGYEALLTINLNDGSYTIRPIELNPEVSDEIQSWISAAVAPKANSADVETELALKADKSEIDEYVTHTPSLIISNPVGDVFEITSSSVDLLQKRLSSGDDNPYIMTARVGSSGGVAKISKSSDNSNNGFLVILFSGLLGYESWVTPEALSFKIAFTNGIITSERRLQFIKRGRAIPRYSDNNGYWDEAPTADSTQPVISRGIYNALQAKQDTLVSGTNIKTINGESVLGEGNLEIKGNETPLITITPTGTDERDMPIGELSDENVAILNELHSSIEIQMAGEETKFLLSFFSADHDGDADTPIVNLAYATIVANEDGGALLGWATDLTYKTWSLILVPLATEAEIQEAGTTINAILQELPNKQDTLVSATNIKTINGQSILGSGDLEIALSQSAQTEVQSMIDAAIGNVLTEEF